MRKQERVGHSARTFLIGEKNNLVRILGQRQLAGTDPACMVTLAMIVTRTLPVPSVLAAVPERDGITLSGHRAEHAIACFNPHHRDDAAKAWTYLTRIRGLQPEAAKALLAELGWPEELFRWSHDWHEEQERVKSGAAKYMDEPCMTVGGRNAWDPGKRRP